MLALILFRSNEEHTSGQDHGYGGKVPYQVVDDDIFDITDLVDTHDLVLNRSVIQLECAAAEQAAAPPPMELQGFSPEKIGKHKEPADRCKPAKSMKQTIRDQADAGCRFIVKMVPMQQLMKYGFIDKGYQAKSEQTSCPYIAVQIRITYLQFRFYRLLSHKFAN